MTTGRIDPRYGDASATAPTWEDIDGRLTAAQLYWLVTVRRNGRPHAVPLCGVWHEGAFFFVTGDEEQKMRNLETNQHVAVTAGPLGAEGWNHGKDIVVEGVAERVTDDALLPTLARAWEVKYQGDWKWEVRDARFFELSDSGGGEGGGQVFRVRPVKGDGLRRRARPDHIPPLVLAACKRPRSIRPRSGRTPSELREPLQFVGVRQRLVPGLGQPTELIVV